MTRKVLVSNYLEGFALASRHVTENMHLLGKEGAMSISRDAARSEIYYVHYPVNDVERGYQDALLSAFGLDGVCAADCLCRNDFNSRRYFHNNEKMNQHLLKSIPSGGMFTIDASWRSANDKDDDIPF